MSCAGDTASTPPSSFLCADSSVNGLPCVPRLQMKAFGLGLCARDGSVCHRICSSFHPGDRAQISSLPVAHPEVDAGCWRGDEMCKSCGINPVGLGVLQDSSGCLPVVSVAFQRRRQHCHMRALWAGCCRMSIRDIVIISISWLLYPTSTKGFQHDDS